MKTKASIGGLQRGERDNVLNSILRTPRTALPWNTYSKDANQCPHIPNLLIEDWTRRNSYFNDQVSNFDAQ